MRTVIPLARHFAGTYLITSTTTSGFVLFPMTLIALPIKPVLSNWSLTLRTQARPKYQSQRHLSPVALTPVPSPKKHGRGGIRPAKYRPVPASPGNARVRLYLGANVDAGATFFISPPS